MRTGHGVSPCTAWGLSLHCMGSLLALHGVSPCTALSSHACALDDGPILLCMGAERGASPCMHAR
eukprot:350228-Chlamydomonas_euryale.AAC.11